MNYLLLIITLILGTSKNLISKGGGAPFSGREALLNINIITAVLALIIFGAGGVGFSAMSAGLIIISAFFGVFIMLSQMLYISALKKEQVSVCSLIYSCGFIIPTFFGAFYYNETILIFDIIGVIVMLAAVWLVSGYEKGHKVSKYLIMAFGAMFSAGMVGVCQKVCIKTFGSERINDCLFVAFAFMLAISAVMKLLSKEKAAKPQGITALLMLLFGIAVVFQNKLNLFLSGEFPSMLFFPTVNGGCIALTSVFAWILFRERLTKKQVAGVVLSLLAIILISI